MYDSTWSNILGDNRMYGNVFFKHTGKMDTVSRVFVLYKVVVFFSGLRDRQDI